MALDGVAEVFGNLPSSSINSRASSSASAKELCVKSSGSFSRSECASETSLFLAWMNWITSG